MKKIIQNILLVIFLFPCIGIAQNEFYNKGALVYIQQNGTNADANYAVATMPTLYVGGSITNTSNGVGNIGDIQNNGEIQLTGDWTQNSNATLQSVGDEVFLGANAGTVNATENKYTQRITGDATGFTGITKDFYNLLIVKPARTVANASIVELGTNVEVAKTIKWLGTGGVIRTDIATHNDAGQDYPYEIYIKDDAVASISGYNTAIGATDKFVEGKLRRQIATTTGLTYFFPIGVDPTHSIGGLNAFEFKFNSSPTSAGILGYLENSSLYAIGNSGVMFCDIGKDPTPGVDDPFNLCAGAPDGILDKMTANKHQDYQWSVTSNTAGTFNNYEIEVFPTVNCEVSALGDLIPSVCGTGAGTYNGLRMEWLAHNGVPGGTPTTSGVGTPFPNTGFFICPVNGNYKRIAAQNGFSKFRLHGVTIPFTVLPIELISFRGHPIDEYNKLEWETATELNTKWHIVERSADNSTFTEIGRKPAAGFSTGILYYSLLDEQPLQKSYYRLKTEDNDGSIQLSPSIFIERTSNVEFAIQQIYPNPATNLINIDYTIPKNKTVQLKIYDELGQIMQESNIASLSGSNRINVNVSHFASALLVVELNDGENRIFEKIVKR